MVLLCGSVEGSEKIAMTILRGACAAIGLLPNHDPPRLNLAGTHVAQIRSS